jgi:hypothetical protein
MRGVERFLYEFSHWGFEVEPVGAGGITALLPPVLGSYAGVISGGAIGFFSAAPGASAIGGALAGGIVGFPAGLVAGAAGTLALVLAGSGVREGAARLSGLIYGKRDRREILHMLEQDEVAPLRRPALHQGGQSAGPRPAERLAMGLRRYASAILKNRDRHWTVIARGSMVPSMLSIPGAGVAAFLCKGGLGAKATMGMSAVALGVPAGCLGTIAAGAACLAVVHGSARIANTLANRIDPPAAAGMSP